MKKGKPILAAVTLGALTYLAWLGLDMKNPEQAAPVTTPYEVVSESVAPPEPAAEPRRVVARKAVKYRKKPAAAPVAETALVDAAPAPVAETAGVDAAPAKTEKVEIPMPNAWKGSFVKHDRPLKRDACDIDRPCSPRGRDGVLLVGATFSLNGWKPMLPEILTVGSYERRTPLLVYK